MRAPRNAAGDRTNELCQREAILLLESDIERIDVLFWNSDPSFAEVRVMLYVGCQRNRDDKIQIGPMRPIRGDHASLLEGIEARGLHQLPRVFVDTPNIHMAVIKRSLHRGLSLEVSTSTRDSLSPTAQKIEGSRVKSAYVECREFDVPTFGLIGRCSALSYACEHFRLAASRGGSWS